VTDDDKYRFTTKDSYGWPSQVLMVYNPTYIVRLNRLLMVFMTQIG